METSLRCQIIVIPLSSRVGSKIKIKVMAMTSHVTKMGTMTSTCGLPQANLKTPVLVPDLLVLGTIVVKRRLLAVAIVQCTGSTMLAAEALGVGVEVEEMVIVNEAPIAFVGVRVHVVKAMLYLPQDPN